MNRQYKCGVQTPRYEAALEWYFKAPLTSLHDEKTVAARTGYSHRTLEASRTAGPKRGSVRGPHIPFVDMGGRSIRYLKLDVEKWILDRAVKDSTSDPGTALRDRHPLDQWLAMSAMSGAKQ